MPAFRIPLRKIILKVASCGLLRLWSGHLPPDGWRRWKQIVAKSASTTTTKTTTTITTTITTATTTKTTTTTTTSSSTTTTTTKSVAKYGSKGRTGNACKRLLKRERKERKHHYLQEMVLQQGTVVQNN